jgi:NAD(P)-dependent dehydrogenase (short-subunit alcohol dehydrogenase family)
MGRLEGRVAIVTGAGRGLGRAHALALAAEGAAVVVNDLGGDVHGVGSSPSAAMEVVAEIESAGGRAVVSGHDVADWEQAGELVAAAVDAFGRLDVLVNNAGIVRDRSLANLAEQEWDDVIRVHLKGHVAPTRHAVAHWKARAKAGEQLDASVVMTSSIAGLAGNFGQAAYSTAKLGVLALSRVVVIEAGGHGVRSNVVSPGARTRISMTMPGAEQAYEQIPVDAFDPHDPANVSPLVVWLAGERCPASGQVFHLSGDRLVVSALPPIVHEASLGRRWTPDDLDKELAPWLVEPIGLEAWAGIE